MAKTSSSSPIPSTRRRAAAAPARASPAATSTMALALPPSTANIPAVPAGFVPPKGAVFAGVLPHLTELAALPSAISELQAFTAYDQTFGATAPAYSDVVQTFVATNAWSQMRAQTRAWDRYALLQEGDGWTLMRSQLARLAPAFNLALVGNPGLAAQFPGLARLLGAKTATARKGASTREANTKAVANGEQPTHGKVGKSRTKAAAKAALLAAQAASSAPTPPAPPAGPTEAPKAATPAPAAPPLVPASSQGHA